MKRALITGASGDIGGAICRKLAQQNRHIIAHSNQRPEKTQALAAEIIAAGGSAESVCFDIRDAEATQVKLSALLEDGPIQIIVNNAGMHRDAPLAGMSPDDWRSVIDVNLNGFYNVTQPLLMAMMQTRWGRIVNISSVAGVMGNRGQCNYSAAKAGLHGATKSLAIELASRGVTVNAIAPGIISGDMTANHFSKDQINFLVPMRRTGQPEEVAALAAFLSSEEASYISGQIIGVNGAMA